MSEHYYSRQPTSVSSRRMLHVELRGQQWRFVTGGGVFSGGRVDPGTRLMAETMEIGEEDAILDLGCGWGVLGIVAARLAPHGRAYLVDVNERAVALARENLRLNEIVNAEVRAGEGTAPFRHLIFDRVLLNPPIRAGAEVVLDLAAQAHAALRPGGVLYFVARTRQGARTLARDLAEIFPRCQEVERQGGYRLYRAQKSAASRP